MISRFQDEYRFLSNFWRCTIEIDDVILPTVEHGYVVRKCGTLSRFLHEAGLDSYELKNKTPGQVKRIGRTVSLRKDWEEVKIPIMFLLLCQKFQDSTLNHRLMKTGNQMLVEGNHWHDNFWGSCSCTRCGNKGENVLGQLLMVVRFQNRYK